jgi:hypothetical protein
MRKTITTTMAVAVAVTGLAGTADASSNATLRQVSIDAVGRHGNIIDGVRTKVSRTDHKSPKGVTVCLQERAAAKVTTIGCGTANASGVTTFKHHQVVAGGTVFRVTHPAGGGLGRFVGCWTKLGSPWGMCQR